MSRMGGSLEKVYQRACPVSHCDDKGNSIWREEQVPFVIRGCFDRAMQRVELIKTHIGKYTTSTHYSLTLDGAPCWRVFRF